MPRTVLVVLATRLLASLLTVRVASAASSTPIAVAPDGAAVWVVSPDSGTVAKIDAGTNARVGEFGVGRHPRTVAVTPTHVYVTNQGDDTVTRLDLDGGSARTVGLAFGCAPYGIVASGAELLVTCEGASTLVVLDADLTPERTIVLAWPEARAIAVGPDGTAYVTHFVTREPSHSGHVSQVDVAGGTVTRVLAIDPDFTTCETSSSGQGVANLLGTVALVPPGAPAAVAGQLWVGGTLHNALRKGLFERSRYFQDKAGLGLFPDLDFHSNPEGEGQAAHRNIYKPALHDIARSVVWKIDLATGAVAGKLDIDHGATAGALAFSPAGDVAHVVDLMLNSYHVFRTERGQGANASTVFGRVSAFGPGGAEPTHPCTGAAGDVVAEDPYILAPQAELVPIGGMEPLDATSLTPVATGLEFTMATGLMRGVPDGVGTTPIGIALSPDGSIAYVANYLARNVAVVNATPPGFRCQSAPATACATRLDCAGGGECMPLVRAVVPSTATDPLPPEILDGKILFTTSARDAAGAGSPIPPFNRLARDGSTRQGEVTSTARDGSSLACASCHADFGGTDGRTWDFSQFGSSLRNTMDLRGRASFAPGTCSHDPNVECTTDAECGPTGSGRRCRNDPAFIPPNIAASARDRFFNPMGTTHWNGDRDEVEDFEFTFRELLGASDCDGAEDKPETCVGALTVRRFVADPADVRVDLSPIPNRTVSPRLDHLGDYVYSLTAFPRNPNLGADGATPSEAARRGRRLFDDPVVHCSFCHNGPSAARQQFTNKGPNNGGYDPTQTPRADLNSPFVRFDVGTANVFDQTNPFVIASDSLGLLGFTLFQNEQTQVPGNRATLNAYMTSLLNDAWNTAPYLHDGSAATLLDVVRPCSTTLDDCLEAGRGRNLEDQHGVTSFLSAFQLNDLAAFEKAPHGPVVEEAGVKGVVMDVKRLQLRFGRKPRNAKLSLRGGANLRGVPLAGVPVRFSIGVPAGEEMAIVARTLPADGLKGSGSGLRFVDRRGTRAEGLRSLVLKVKGGRLAFRAAGAKMDLEVLRRRDPDYTIALELGDFTVGATRHFTTNKKGTVTKGP